MNISTYDLKLLDTYDDMSTFHDGLIMKIVSLFLLRQHPLSSTPLSITIFEERLPTIIILNISQCVATHCALGSTLNVEEVFVIF